MALELSVDDSKMFKKYFIKMKRAGQKRGKRFRSPCFEKMEDRRLFAFSGFEVSNPDTASSVAPLVAGAEGESGISLRHNRINPFDVNHDGLVAPVDALVVINVLRRFGSDIPSKDLDMSYQGYFDVDDNSFVSPTDVLQVINYLTYSTTQFRIPGSGGLTYGIGNSLTNDFVFPYNNKGFDLMTSSTPNSPRTGVHLNCSQSLTRIWANPDEVCLETAGFGKYREFLTRPVDNVLLQPHYGATVGQEIQSMKNLIDYTKQNPENSDTRFFVYAPWGTRLDSGAGIPFYDAWHSYQATLDRDFIPSASAYDLITSELTKAGYQVTLIPAGHAWVSAIDAIRAGTSFELITTVNGVHSLRSLSEEQLWRDPIHASSVGSFLAAATVYSAIYGVPPVGLDPTLLSFQVSSYDYYLSPGGARLAEQFAWQAYFTDRFY